MVEEAGIEMKKPPILCRRLSMFLAVVLGIAVSTETESKKAAD